MQKEKRKNDPAILIQNMMESQLIQWRWTNVNHTYYTFAHRAKKILEENIFTSIFEIECSKENYKKFHNLFPTVSRYGDENIEYPKGMALIMIFVDVNFNSRKVKRREKYEEENAKKATNHFSRRSVFNIFYPPLD